MYNYNSIFFEEGLINIFLESAVAESGMASVFRRGRGDNSQKNENFLSFQIVPIIMPINHAFIIKNEPENVSENFALWIREFEKLS